MKAVGQWPTFFVRDGRREATLPQASLEEVTAFAVTHDGREAEVERLIAPSLAAMGYDIVRVRLSGREQAKLQIMAERQDRAAMRVEHCAEISRATGAILDVEDPIAGSYTLEVSSPGIDRPLTRLDDFERFAGFEVKLELRTPIDGRRRFRGRLLGLDGSEVRLIHEDNEVRLSGSEIIRAKLVMTDDLIAASRSAEAL